jgi:hypothetical protein
VATTEQAGELSPDHPFEASRQKPYSCMERRAGYRHASLSPNLVMAWQQVDVHDSKPVRAFANGALLTRRLLRG